MRGRASGDRIFGFWLREVVEHVCGFGFVRQSLDLHRSNKLSHGLRDAMESRSSRQTCVTSDGDVHVRIFFAC